MSEANKEFKEQLRMQELYTQRNADDSDPYTYTDPEDGTVYDWDHDKKAWFPKVGAFSFPLRISGPNNGWWDHTDLTSV